MGLLDKAKEAAEQARQAASQAVDGVRSSPQAPPASPPPVGTPEGAPPAPGAVPETEANVDWVDGPPPPQAVQAEYSAMDDFKSHVKKATRRSKDAMATLVEKIDPSVLAELIIKVTAAQEKANIALSQKRSPYRIAEINVTATIPPQIGFSVQRMGDMEELDDPSSLDLLDDGVIDADEVITSLEGDDPIEELGPPED